MTITSRGTSFSCPSKPELDPRLKETGWRYLSVSKAWMTTDITKVIPFLEHCDEKTAKTVVAWQASRSKAIEASTAVNTDLVIPAPPGLAYRAYQAAGIAFMRARPATLNADVPRLGKTIQTLGVINTYDRPLRTLVICPANAKVNWTREAEKWLVNKTTVGYAEGDDLPDVDFLVINFTILARHIDKIQAQRWDVIVVDEAHFLGNPTSARTRNTMGLSAELHFICLTGTPIYTRPKQLWPMLQKIDPTGLGANWWRFCKRYCDAGHGEDGRWDDSGSSNEEELQFRLRSSVMIRREKSDVMEELPTQRQTVYLPKTGLSALIKREKSAFEKHFGDLFTRLEQDLDPEDFKNLEEFDVRMESNDIEEDLGDLPLASVRRELALAKVGMVVEFVEELLLSEHKVVVFAHHRDVVLALKEALKGFGVAHVIGGMSTTKRQENIDRFRDDPDCRVFVGNIMAAGSAISLAAADTAVFAELSWVPSEVDQAEERVWDPTKTRPVSIYRLVLENSLEAQIAYVMEARQAKIDRMMVAKYLGPDLSI